MFRKIRVSSTKKNKHCSSFSCEFHLILRHEQTYKLSSLTEFYTDPHVDPQSDRFKRVSSSLSGIRHNANCKGCDVL